MLDNRKTGKAYQAYPHPCVSQRNLAIQHIKVLFGYLASVVQIPLQMYIFYISIYSSSHYPLSPSDYEQMYFNSTLERVLFVRTTLTPSSISCLLFLSYGLTISKQKTNLSWPKPINKPKCCQVHNGPEHPNQAKPKADGQKTKMLFHMFAVKLVITWKDAL